MIAGVGLTESPGLVDGLIPRKGGAMPAPRKYPDELRDRAQRLVAEAMSEDPSLSMNEAVKRITPNVGAVPERCAGARELDPRLQW